MVLVIIKGVNSAIGSATLNPMTDCHWKGLRDVQDCRAPPWPLWNVLLMTWPLTMNLIGVHAFAEISLEITNEESRHLAD